MQLLLLYYDDGIKYSHNIIKEFKYIQRKNYFEIKIGLIVLWRKSCKYLTLKNRSSHVDYISFAS